MHKVEMDSSAYQEKKLASELAARIQRISHHPIRLMEVCGTHTMSIFKSGIRSLLPPQIELLSGPGCPVCVTAQAEIDALIALSREPGRILATFGDLLRVPGTESSLRQEAARGADIRVVYSAFDALQIAKAHPDRSVVFAGIGFETTAPTVAATLMAAKAQAMENLFVYPAHKRVIPALFALMENPAVRVDGFILPGHVSVIIGTEAYRPFFKRHPIPCAVAGFEPADILLAIWRLVRAAEENAPMLENLYQRAVSDSGNPRAQQVMDRVFVPEDAVWRGLGRIPQSGLGIREPYRRFDANHGFNITVPPAQTPPGCACGQILTGAKKPPDCPLFASRCTPLNPVGPCMVSSEGTCAAYYRYGR